MNSFAAIPTASCATCQGTGYSVQARDMNKELVDRTFDALERHRIVVARCHEQGLEHTCPVCHGDGTVKN